jgi:hypothetical protein
LGATLAACSAALKINTEHDPSADFSRLKTYAWASSPSVPDAVATGGLVDWRVRAAVDRELQAKAYVLVDGARADFLVDYRITRKAKQVDTFQDYYWYRRAGGKADLGGAYVRGYEEGTLVVQIVDPRSKRLLWFGSASGVADAEQHVELIRQAVTEMFERFPPR